MKETHENPNLPSAGAARSASCEYLDLHREDPAELRYCGKPSTHWVISERGNRAHRMAVCPDHAEEYAGSIGYTVTPNARGQAQPPTATEADRKNV
jgi:hypothetical protein